MQQLKQKVHGLSSTLIMTFQAPKSSACNMNIIIKINATSHKTTDAHTCTNTNDEQRTDWQLVILLIHQRPNIFIDKTFKKLHYTTSNSHPKLAVKNYFSSIVWTLLSISLLIDNYKIGKNLLKGDVVAWPQLREIKLRNQHELDQQGACISSACTRDLAFYCKRYLAA